jgi:hypothetical protein
VTSPVRIETKAWTDHRFATVARLLGLADLEHALIKVAKIWSWQTEHYTPEEPTYVVDRDTIESALDHEGAAEALVRAKLAEELPEGYRMRGTTGRIEWLHQRREAAARGGKARQRKARDNSKPGGSAPGLPSAELDACDSKPNTCPPVPVPPPEEDLSLPRAIPPSPEPQAPVPHHPEAPLPRSSWHDRMRWWTAMLDADQRLRAAGIEPDAPSLPPAPAGENEKNLAKCASQLADAGFDAATVDAKMLHVVAIAEAEAKREGNRLWFKPALIFAPDRANRAVDTSLAEASTPRAGPQRSAGRAHRDHSHPYLQPGIRKIPQL